jgi:hypothetical protein
MDNENDLILINNIKKGFKEDSSLEILYSRHAGIYHKILNKYMPINTPEKQDLFKECKYHIFLSALDFNETKKTKFSSYLGNRTRWMCLNFFYEQRRDKQKTSLSFTNQDFSECFLEEMLDNESIDKIKLFLHEHEDKRAFKIFEMRYFKSKGKKLTPWKYISKNLNLSVQGCINIHNNFIEKIKNTSQISK